MDEIELLKVKKQKGFKTFKLKLKVTGKNTKIKGDTGLLKMPYQYNSETIIYQIPTQRHRIQRIAPHSTPLIRQLFQ